MKTKFASVLVIVAILLAVGVVVRAQEPQQSIEEQIKQKEAELERLKEIKKRQDQIRQLQDEVKRLEAGQSVPSGGAPQAPVPQTTPSPTPGDQPETAEMPIVSSPTTTGTAPRSFAAGETAATSDLPPFRSCDVVRTLSTQATTTHTPNPTSLAERYVCRVVSRIKREKEGSTDPKHPRQPNPEAGLNVNTDFFPLLIVLLAREGRAQYVVAAEDESVDTQVSSDASSSGSTSLVTQGSVPAILGFAVDNGGLLKSTNGSTITFRGNVAGLAKAFSGKGFISGYDEDSPAARFLRRAAFSFSFDASRGDQPGVFTGNKQQISNYSLHLDLYNKRDPRDARYREDWKKFLSGVSESLSGQIQSSFSVLYNPSTRTWNDPALQSWYVLIDQNLRNAKAEQVETIFLDQLAKAPKNLSDTTLTELRSFDKRFKAWLDEREIILDKIAKAPIVSFEYINDRPLNSATLSKFNLIAELGFGPRLDLSFNGALTMFNKKPSTPGVNRVRDFQFATQFDVPFGEIGLGIGKPVLSFAGRYERLMADATTTAGTTVPNTQGTIGVGQVKLVIPIKNSGVRIPFSFSFANRTELIREREVRGNFGFTFDLDTLFAKFKPF
jgi:hypothetical protein